MTLCRKLFVHNDIYIYIVISSIIFKKPFVIELMIRFEENFDWEHHLSLGKYEDLQEQYARNSWITNVFSVEVRFRGFIANSSSSFLTNLGLSPSDKKNT